MYTIHYKDRTKLLRAVRLVAIWLLIIGALTACVDDHDVGGDEPYADDAAPEPVTETPAASDSWITDYADYIEAQVDQNAIPGLALIQGDEIVLVRGYGLRDIEHNKPVTPDTLFHIGSTHKSMTAMLIATLVDDEIVEWDTPVVEIYPEFALSDPDATQAVTLRHLLSMRSGIPDEAEDDLDMDYATPHDVFAVAAEAELFGMPGEAFSYSNISASLAGYLGVIAADGTQDDLYGGYAQLLQERVLDPIGMATATVYASQAHSNPNMSKSYDVERGKPVLAEIEDYDGDALAPAGSLKASVTEMAWYVMTQMNEGVAPNGTRVVSEANLAETWEPYLEDYGMGWETKSYAGTEIIAHEGAYDHFVSVIAFVPEYEVGLVILVNSEKAGGALIERAPEQLVAFVVEAK